MEKRKGIYKGMGMLFAAVLACGMFLSACREPALASEISTAKEGADPALIDSERECSLTVYKYDMSTAAEDGIEIDEDALAYGQADTDVQELFADYAVEGVEFSYLYCGDMRTYTGGSADDTEIELLCAVPEELCLILNLEESDAYPMSDAAESERYYSTDQIQTALKELLENGSSEETDKNMLGKNALEEYLIENENTNRMPLTDAEGMTSVSGLSTGLYLVVETKVPENVTETVNPWFVTLPYTVDTGDEWEYDLTCYPKNQTGMPTLDKLVRDAIEAADGRKTEYEETATASEGETLEYILVSRLPHIQSRATWLTEYTFSDVLSEGLTYGEDATIAFYASREAAFSNDLDQAAETWDVSSDPEKMYAQEYGKTKENAAFSGTTMTVSMTEDGLKRINENYSDYWMTVSYTATMHSDESVVTGDAGNPNEVTLLWRRTNDVMYDTLEDECFVYTFGVDLEKQFSDGKGDPEKAKFLLKYKTDQTYVTARTVTEEDGQKIYYVTGRTEKKEDATRFSAAEGGTCQIIGLRADTYELTEEKTDKHYQLLSHAIEFTITQTERNGSQIETATAMVDGQTANLKEDGMLHLQVINYRRVVIPKTGDSSLPLATVFGAGAVVCGCLVLRRKKAK